MFVVVVVVATNAMDFHGYPSSLHECPHLFVDSPLEPLESWYHAFF
jgi:hypothetical protein